MPAIFFTSSGEVPAGAFAAPSSIPFFIMVNTPFFSVSMIRRISGSCMNLPWSEDIIASRMAPKLSVETKKTVCSWR